MAESVPEQQGGAVGGGGGGWDGLAVGLSGRLICQIKAPKIWATDKAPSRLGNPHFSSNSIKKTWITQKKDKHTERTGCAPCLSSPCPWSSVSRNDGEPKWPRLPPLASPRCLSIQCASCSPPRKKPPNLLIYRWSAQQNRWGMTVLRVRTAGWNNSRTHSARAGKRRCHGGSQQCVPHGTASRGATHPDPRFLFHTAHSQFMHFNFFFLKNKA